MHLFFNLQYRFCFINAILLLNITEISSLLQYKISAEILSENFPTKRYELIYTNPQSDFFHLSSNLTHQVSSPKDHPSQCLPQINETTLIWLINDEPTYDCVINYFLTLNNNNKSYKLAIIIPSQFTIKHTKTYPPFFTIDQKYMDELIKFSTSKNATAVVTYERLLLNYPIEYFVISICATSVVSLILFVIFCKMRYQMQERNILSIHKIINTLPLISFFLSVLTSIEIYQDYISKINNKINDFIMLERVLSVLGFSIFKTLFWSGLLLMSYGWEIVKNDIRNFEIKVFIFVYLFIYSCFCYDKIIDAAFKENSILIFSYTEVKTIIIQFILFGMILYFSLKNLKILKYTIQYNKIHCGDLYIPQLKYKVTMIKKIIFFSFSYLVSFVGLITAEGLLFSKYIEIDNSLFKVINNYVLDIVFEICFMFLFFPTKLPRHFRVYFDIRLSRYNERVLKGVLPKKENLISSKGFLSGIERKESSIPLIVIKPVFSDDFRREKQVKYVDLEGRELEEQIIFDKIELGYENYNN